MLRPPLELPLEQYRAIVEAAAVMIWRSDTQGRATYLNDAWQRFTGRSSTGDLGHRWAEAVHPDDRERCVANFVSHLKDQLPFEMEYRIRRHDGEYRWCLDRGVPYTNSAGAFAGFIGVITDIHTQRAAREQVGALADAREALEFQVQVQRAITENAASGLVLVNESGNTTYMNAAAVALLGYTQEELSRMTLHAAVHHSRPDGTPFPPEECPYYKAFFSGVPNVNSIEWLVRKDGTFFAAQVSMTPIRRAGRVTGAVYEFRDFTDQHRAEEALREADRRKDQFLAILGHELRNPIATIQNAMEVIARRTAGDSGRMHDIVLRQAEHLHRLVDDLLDVARVQTGKISLARATLDARDVARAVIDAAETAGRLRDHRVSVSLPGEAVWVYGDRGRLEQLVGNFLDNAVKFTPRGRAIRVGVERREGRAAIWVEDEGSGIDDAARSRLFQLFAQADQPLDRPFGGLGVGLALARAIAELHGGEVRADTAAGKGSVFSVLLPLSQPARPGAPERRRPAGAPSRRILIVEDNADAREALAALLEDEGHVVTALASGREAVARLHETDADIAFVDVGLPEMDGYAVARAFRANGGRRMRLVALTGYGQPQDVERALAAGFDAHITKPAGIEQLGEAIAAVRDD